MPAELVLYRDLLTDIKTRVRQAQHRAALSANAEMLLLYWDIGRLIDARQKQEGWGAGFIPRLAADLKNELPEQKGFSLSNLKRMIRFYEEYPQLPALSLAKSPRPVGQFKNAEMDPIKIGQQPTAQLEGTSAKQTVILSQPAVKLKRIESNQNAISPLPVGQLAMPPEIFFGIPWAHHVILLEKLDSLAHRLWYARQAVQNGWSRETLIVQIRNRARERFGAAVTNFKTALPEPHAAIAESLLKDPYVFDFFTIADTFRERELETKLLIHIQKFLLELGRGFAFVGRQYRLEVGEREIHLDLLFYHLHLRSYLVIDLKKGEFKPEYAGKMNFYCSVADAQLRREHDAPTIGLILCQTKDRVVAEYALRDIHKPIGVAEYELTRALPARLASSLPSIESIEAEFAEHKKHKTPARKTPQKPITPKTHKTKTPKPAKRRV